MHTYTSLPVPAIVAISVGAALIVVGLFLLLHFTVFAQARLRKVVREYSGKFEYLHALLFGQDSQYIKRIENISMTNLLYVSTFMSFQKRFKDIRDRSDSAAQAAINGVKDRLNDRDYKGLKEILPACKERLDAFEELVNSMNDDLLAVIKPEEECRQASLQLKEKLRTVKQDYYVKQADLSLASASFDKVFKKIDLRFSEFEAQVESANYEDAKAILPAISSVIDELGKDLVDMPSLCVTIQSVIPEKLVSLENRYDDMIREEYPLHHLMDRSAVEALREQLAALSKRVEGFDLYGVQAELDGILAKIDEYLEAFDKEKESRRDFDSHYEEVYREAASVDKKYIRLCNSLPDVRKIFVISEEQTSNLDSIKNMINKAGATKRSLDTLIHSAVKQPFSILLEKMNTLRSEAREGSEAIDDFDAYLLSLKSDSEADVKAIGEQFSQIKESEKTLRLIRLPSVDGKYSGEVERVYSLIDQAYSILRTLPIDVAAANSLIRELKMRGDALSDALLKDHKDMVKADCAILYANRDRRGLSDLNAVLSQAEALYQSGDFAKAYKDAEQAIARIKGQQ